MLEATMRASVTESRGKPMNVLHAAAPVCEVKRSLKR